MAVCNSITMNLEPFAYAFAISIGFVVARYLIAYTANDERGKYEARYMFGEFVLGLVLALSFAMIIEHISTATSDSILKLAIDTIMGSLGASNSNYVVAQDQTLLCSALSYLAHISAYSMEVYKLNAWISMNAGAAANYQVTFNAANYYAGQISYQYSFAPLGNAASAWEDDFLGRASFISYSAMLPNTSQYFLLSLFISNAISTLLAMAVMFRTLPFTKGFANLLLALILTFLVILPILLYGESYTFHPPLPSEVESVVFSDVRSDFKSFSLVVDNPFAEAAIITGLSLISGPLESVKDIVMERYKMEEGTLYIAGDKVVNYFDVLKLNARTTVNSAFLATINFLAVAVSVKTLQIMLGDTDSLIEVFLRWV